MSDRSTERFFRLVTALMLVVAFAIVSNAGPFKSGSGPNFASVDTVTLSGTQTVTGAKTFGPGQVVVEVGAAGATPLVVRQTGGVAGTDDVLFYHTGDHGYIDNQSGVLFVGTSDATGTVALGPHGGYGLLVSEALITLNQPLAVNQKLYSTPATVQDIATAGTITLPTTFVKRLTASAGAATGVILTAGATDGQILCLFNVHASNSIQFDAAGTSNVADGTGTTIAPLTGKKLVWDATSSRWYVLK